MECPDCKKEMFLIHVGSGFITPFFNISEGKHRETKDEAWKCQNCLLEVYAQLTITRLNRIIRKTTQIGIEDHQKQALIESSSL